MFFLFLNVNIVFNVIDKLINLHVTLKLVYYFQLKIYFVTIFRV